MLRFSFYARSVARCLRKKYHTNKRQPARAALLHILIVIERVLRSNSDSFYIDSDSFYMLLLVGLTRLAGGFFSGCLFGIEAIFEDKSLPGRMSTGVSSHVS